jgi:hypothetical protein
VSKTVPDRRFEHATESELNLIAAILTQGANSHRNSAEHNQSVGLHQCAAAWLRSANRMEALLAVINEEFHYREFEVK